MTEDPKEFLRLAKLQMREASFAKSCWNELQNQTNPSTRQYLFSEAYESSLAEKINQTLDFETANLTDIYFVHQKMQVGFYVSRKLEALIRAGKSFYEAIEQLATEIEAVNSVAKLKGK